VSGPAPRIVLAIEPKDNMPVRVGNAARQSLIVFREKIFN
jgi:hypothetical protein